jgi:hypothetical protein
LGPNLADDFVVVNPLAFGLLALAQHARQNVPLVIAHSALSALDHDASECGLQQLHLLEVLSLG